MMASAVLEEASASEDVLLLEEETDFCNSSRELRQSEGVEAERRRSRRSSKSGDVMAFVVLLIGIVCDGRGDDWRWCDHML